MIDFDSSTIYVYLRPCSTIYTKMVEDAYVVEDFDSIDRLTKRVLLVIVVVVVDIYDKDVVVVDGRTLKIYY